MGFGLRIGAAKSRRNGHAGLIGQLLVRRLCDALLFPSLLLVPSLLRAATRFSGTAFGLRPALAKSCRSGHAGLVGQLLFPSLLRRPVSLGPLSGFARRLQSPVETGTPTRRRSEGTRFSETSLVPSGACNPRCPSSGTPE